MLGHSPGEISTFCSRHACGLMPCLMHSMIPSDASIAVTCSSSKVDTLQRVIELQVRELFFDVPLSFVTRKAAKVQIISFYGLSREPLPSLLFGTEHQTPVYRCTVHSWWWNPPCQLFSGIMSNLLFSRTASCPTMLPEHLGPCNLCALYLPRWVWLGKEITFPRTKTGPWLWMQPVTLCSKPSYSISELTDALLAADAQRSWARCNGRIRTATKR